MVVIAGIGVRGYKRMSGEMALYLSETQIKQIVTSTVLEAKRNRIPMQIQVHVPNDVNTQSCVISGGSGSLVGYWGFEGNTPNVGLRRLALKNPIQSWGGYFGKGARFNGETNPLQKPTSLFSFHNNVYMEVMLNPDMEQIFSSTIPGAELDILNGGDGKFRLVLVNDNDSGLRVKAVLNNGQNKIEVISDRYFPDDAQWHKVGISTMGGDDRIVSIYIDSVLINSKVGNSVGNAGALENFSIGKSYWGLMDDVKIYRLGGGQEVSLNPRDTIIVGQVNNTTRYINISPYGTLSASQVIQIASTRLTGKLSQVPNVNGAPVEYGIAKIRSTVPKAGYLTFGGGMTQYEWNGSKKLKITEDEMYGTISPNTGTFQVIKPVVIRKDGVVK